ncbi:SAM-dependent methyltransferase [Actinomadura sp. 7K534]|uniref:SAM-dependent methyltransferase n=1 Tax=Actinomadura sp. 7K534 TaxID=2530366 RepID=UPI001049B4C3|nr:SAM-dependent methyltransferase [Actinomadura sp. 7K534]TDB86969.1 SAM-dependent methyltransferase [Actinomadura sp. 7K534]
MTASRAYVASPHIDTTVPHSARVWDYWLGGKDNYEVDRVLGDAYRDVFPGIVDIARAQRLFLCRAVRFLAGEMGVRQFLDIGTGLPALDNTHEVAQQIAPDARVVYVDNDPLVLAHGRALLTSTLEGATDFIEADVCAPGDIVEQAAVTLLDLRRPVAVLMLGILGHIGDGEAHRIVRQAMAPLVPGSYLAVCDGVITSAARAQAHDAYNKSGAAPYILRTSDQIGGFLDGLEFVDPGEHGPGMVAPHLWRPELPSIRPVIDVEARAGVGRKVR